MIPYHLYQLILQVEYKSYYQWVPFVLFLQVAKCSFCVSMICFRPVFSTLHMDCSSWLKVERLGDAEFVSCSCLVLQVAEIISGLHEPGAILHDEERVGRHKVLGLILATCTTTLAGLGQVLP